MKNLKHLAIILFSTFCLYSCGGKSSSENSGEYTDKEGSGKQVQYQGSKEQQADLDAMDEYSKDHPEFE